MYQKIGLKMATIIRQILIYPKGQKTELNLL